MNDYISREAALREVCLMQCNDTPENCELTECKNCGNYSAFLAIPPADVQPVVLCKDCIHRPYSSEPGKTSGFAVESPDRECKCPCFNPDDGYYSWIPADDFFCADGERRSADMRPAPEPTAEKPAAICQTCGNFEACPWKHEYVEHGDVAVGVCSNGRVVACSDYKDKKG